jgi:putative hemolysin
MALMLAALCLVAFAAIGATMRLIEVTFTRLGRARASGLDEVDGAEGRLLPLVFDRERVLGPAVLLRLLSQVGIVAIATVLAADRLGSTAAAVTVGVTGLVVFVVVETVPQRWALERNDQSARLVAPVAFQLSRLAGATFLVRGLVRLSHFIGPRNIESGDPEVGEDELLAMAEAAARADVIADDEAGLIESIISLGDTIARTVMVPRPDMVKVDHTASARDAIRLVLDHGYTRLPVAGDDVDDIVGVVLAKDLMRIMLAGRDALPLVGLGIVRSTSFVPESKKVSELMREMQGSRMHMAIVVDEYGGTAGLVTLEDIIEELLGEIVDEYDDESPLVEDLGDDRLRVSGRLPIDDLVELLGSGLPEGDWDTVGGLLFDLLGHVPTEGETVRSNGHVLTAERVDGRRIDSVIIEPAGADVELSGADVELSGADGGSQS